MGENSTIRAWLWGLAFGIAYVLIFTGTKS